MIMTCVITDDEPIAREILEDYVRMIPDLRLVASCKNAAETMAALREHHVDILFADIQMPGISGLDLIRSLRNPPFIIFTTAFPNYAIDGFELDAVDYLLKPIAIDRFLRAVSRVYSRLPAQPAEGRLEIPKKFFFIKANSDLLKVEYDSILYIEGLENYVRIHCENRLIVSFTTMKNMEDLLAPHNFLRIHRSYLVNMSKVSRVQQYTFRVGNHELTAGKSYRKAVAEMLKNYYTA